ncbi:MAG: hypothetical protein J6P46_08545 [Bacteroidales bacterium]|nr:hypothetical protein [Bacteroidales bacterium]
MILLYPGKWSNKAGRLLKYSRVYTNKGEPTPFVIARFRHVGCEPAAPSVPLPVATETRKLVRVCGEKIVYGGEAEHLRKYGVPNDAMYQGWIEQATYQLYRQLIPRMAVKTMNNSDGSIVFRAELWIAEGGTNGQE